MRTRLLLLIPAFCLASCGGGAEVRKPPSTATEPQPAAQGGTRTPAPAVNRRVILRDARSRVTMILVNRGHSWRRSSKGRLRLALGKSGNSYKVLEEREMDALLESLRNFAVQRYASTFERGDEAYLDEARVDGRFRAILYLEQGDSRRKVLSFRPYGTDDVDGQQRLQNFVGLKGLVYKWYNSHSESENPVSGTSMPGTKR